MTTSIDINELSKRLSSGGQVTLLDVRRQADADADPRCIAGAAYRNPEQIDEWIKGLPAGKPAVVYCVKGGSVSQSVTERLRKEGIAAVFLEGGLKAWTEGGQPVVTVSALSYRIDDADIEMLRRAGVAEPDIAHSVKVAEKALDIAGRTGQPLDFELVGRGALFHDLGKARTHAIEHGKIGAEMGAALGLPATVTAVMEKHIRGGLSEAEAIELGLPVKDYTLGTLEERIIIYADRLVDIITDGIVTLKNERESEARFEEILRTIPKYGKNEKTLARYLGYHREIQACLGT